MRIKASSLAATTIDAVRPLHTAYTRASWQATTTGALQAIQAEGQAQAALMRSTKIR